MTPGHAALFDEPLTVPIAVGTLLTLGEVALIVSGRSAEAPPERLCPFVTSMYRWMAASSSRGLRWTHKAADYVNTITGDEIRRPLSGLPMFIAAGAAGPA